MPALGQTTVGRRLAVIFTTRGSLMHVISARDVAGAEGMKKRTKLTKKTIPQLSSRTPSSGVWAQHDTTDYFDWTKAKRPSLGSLKPSTRPRFPSGYQLSMLEELKTLANEKDVPYQSLLKVYLDRSA